MATTENSYASTVNPAPYSQAVFLSQKMINDSFSHMWQLAQNEPDEKNPLRYFKYESRNGSLEFDVGKPTVSLQVTTNDPMLFFKLRMTRGKVSLFLSPNPKDDTKLELEIDNWVFAFSVKIERKQITKDSQEFREYKERAGLPNSNFSLAMLFIDASSTTKWNPGLSCFGKTDFLKNLTDQARSTFTNGINEWLTYMNVKRTNIIGYSARRQEEDKELNEYAPTFPPTSIDYSSYPWKGLDGSQKKSDNLDTNAISYLMMSNFQDPPVSGSIEYSGAWVDGDRDGTFVMSRGLFWPWMQSLMREIVIGMVPYPNEPVCYYSPSDPDLPFNTEMNFQVGDPLAQTNQYQFPEMKQGEVWKLSGEYRTSRKNAVNEIDMNDKMVVMQWCSDVSASLKFHPGKELVDLYGSSTFCFRAEHRSKVFTYTAMTFAISWHIKFTMAAVEDGGLQFAILRDTDTPPIQVTPEEEGNMRWSQDPKEVAKEWTDELSKSLRFALERVEDRLVNGLADHHRLFLPGKGSYLMKDPIFSGNGDLLANLTFNGADPPKPEPSKRHLYTI